METIAVHIHKTVTRRIRLTTVLLRQHATMDMLPRTLAIHPHGRLVAEETMADEVFSMMAVNPQANEQP